jgi:hypothetical protein
MKAAPNPATSTAIQHQRVSIGRSSAGMRAPADIGLRDALRAVNTCCAAALT